MIAWQYLDKKSAAIDALKDYGSMEYIIEHSDEEIYALESKMENPKNAVINGMPGVQNPKASEDRMASCIDEINVLKERYRQALEYMEWFGPAWDALTDEERYILETFFLTSETKTGAVQSIGTQLSIERSQVYYRKEKAVGRLSLLLFGK